MAELTKQEARRIVGLCSFRDYAFHVDDNEGGIYIYATYEEEDTVTHQKERQVTRAWPLESDYAPSQIVSTLFKCALTSMEHRTREWFTYRGQPIFHPHRDVEMLVALCVAEKE